MKLLSSCLLAAVVVAAAAPARAEAPLVANPTRERVWMDVDPGSVAAANTNKIYLNDCKPNGCVITPGSSNSINNRWGINNTRTLTPFNASATVWNNFLTCMTDVFAPFGVQLLTTDPGNTPHFEIMVAGSPTDLGMSNGIGGIAPFNCSVEYIPNALVFAFSKVYGNNAEELCATAAQEIAHAFRLDHVTDPSDPLTYFRYNGRRKFKDAQVQCGSDCVNGRGPFNQQCTGPNVGGTGPQNHACYCTGSQTQNSYQTILSLFGNGTPTPPTVSIVKPMAGAHVSPGFAIHAEVEDINGVAKVEFRIGGQLFTTATQAPYFANAPDSLADGTHTLEVTGYDSFGASAKASVQVVIGKPCGRPADCPSDTDTCINGRCVPGPGVQGGLGTACDEGAMCASGLCADDGNAKYCVEICTPGAGHCPAGFGCSETGDGSGICWPGYDDGSGGCTTGSGGPIGIGLGFAAALWLSRRRRA